MSQAKLNAQQADLARRKLLQNARQLYDLADNAFQCGSGGHCFGLLARASDELTLNVLLIAAQPDLLTGKGLIFKAATQTVLKARLPLLYSNYLQDAATDNRVGGAVIPTLEQLTRTSKNRWHSTHVHVDAKADPISPHDLFGNGGVYYVHTCQLKDFVEGRLLFLASYDSSSQAKAHLDGTCGAGSQAKALITPAIV